MIDKDWYKKKEELNLRIEMIPKRILQLQLEIDQLKERFKEYQEELYKMTNKEQKEIHDHLKKVKITYEF